MPRLFSGLENPLARIRLTEYRHRPLGTDTLLFQIESRPNVPLHRPSAVEVLGTLYMIKGDAYKNYSGDSRVTRLTHKFSRIAC